jgi:hypothetical protein
MTTPTAPGRARDARTREEQHLQGDNAMTTQWTPEAIRALGATTDLPTLGSIFGLGRWRSYQMAHTGEWEQAGIRIIPIGARYRVAVQSILDVLSQGSPPTTDASAEQAEPGPVPPPEAGNGAAWQPPGRAAGSRQ